MDTLLMDTLLMVTSEFLSSHAALIKPLDLGNVHKLEELSPSSVFHMLFAI